MNQNDEVKDLMDKTYEYFRDIYEETQYKDYRTSLDKIRMRGKATGGDVDQYIKIVASNMIDEGWVLRVSMTSESPFSSSDRSAEITLEEATPQVIISQAKVFVPEENTQ